jgi:hypothetical protein
MSTDPRGPFGYSLIRAKPNIVQEAWYVWFFGPQQYVFAFDKQGLLIARYRFRSP